MNLFLFSIFYLLSLTTFLIANNKSIQLDETLPSLNGGKAPQTWDDAWLGFDPRKEPMEVEVLREWEEDGVLLRVVRYRIGVFKGKKAMMAGSYGFPKGETS